MHQKAIFSLANYYSRELIPGKKFTFRIACRTTNIRCKEMIMVAFPGNRYLVLEAPSHDEFLLIQN